MLGGRSQASDFGSGERCKLPQRGPVLELDEAKFRRPWPHCPLNPPVCPLPIKFTLKWIILPLLWTGHSSAAARLSFYENAGWALRIFYQFRLWMNMWVASGEWNCDPSLTRAIPEPSSDESVLGRNRNEICAVNLVNSYCLPSLWYRCEIWNPSSSDYRRLNVIWNNVLLAWECLVPPLLLQSIAIILHNWSKKNSLLEEN